MHFDLPKSIVYMTLHGSKAYGTNVEGSDSDYKGVCIPPKDITLDPYKTFEQYESKDPTDLVVYNLDKFFVLAANCNPNIIEVLWTDPTSHFYVHPIFQKILDNRDLFLSKKARYSFAGYAHAQLKRINTHKRWLLNPPTKFPVRPDFGLKEQPDLSKAEINTLHQIKDILPCSAQRLLELEKNYQNALKEWNQYLDWKTNRNAERAKTEALYGFDVKHGMHLIRLMRMCVEILSEKGVQVKRSDREFLVSIRRGEVFFDDLLFMAQYYDGLAAALYETSSLQYEPDRQKLSELYRTVVEEFWRESNE